MIKEIIEKLCNKNDLDEEEINFFFSSMMKGEMTDSQSSAFLIALKIKEPSSEEIFHSAKILLSNLEESVDTDLDIIDLCGTGGDSKSTLNVSTISSLILATLGAKVAKHGNRSVSSRVGSADLIESLNIPLDDSIESAINSIENNNLSFLFAPYFHKSMKNVAHVRQQLGTRTIFNILGPLVNPLRPKKQILGVYDKKLIPSVAQALVRQGVTRGMVIHGLDGMDEVSICDNTFISEINNGEIKDYVFNPREYGFELADLANLVVNSVEESKDICIKILKNEIKDSKRDICILNAGAAAYIYGLSDSLRGGFDIVKSNLENGTVFDRLDEIFNF